MDAKYFAEIKAREQAATPGPWKMNEEPKGSHFFGTIHGEAGISFSGNRADNDFIAHARSDIPALLAEVERLNQQIATLKRALELACAELNLSDVEKVFAPDYFIQQAQEQEGHDG